MQIKVQNINDFNHPAQKTGVTEKDTANLNQRETWDKLTMPAGLPPKRILLLLILSIFTGEIGVMFLLHLWPTLPFLQEALIDASVLVLILSPTFYYFHYRPMAQNFRQRNLVMDQLARSEERQHLALHAVNDGLWDWNVKSGSVYYSPRCALMLGYQPETFDPNFDSLKNLIHPEDRERFNLSINEHLNDLKENLDIELRLKCHSDRREWLWVQVRGKVVARDNDGTPLRAVGTNTNIQARKQTEEALQQSEEGVRYLSQQLIQTSEVEKKRLAQELHDDIGQMITAIKMGVEMIRSQQCDQHPELEFHCVRLLEMGKRMEGSLHEICDDLHPAILDDLGLPRTLEWMINKFSEQHKEIQIRIEQSGYGMRLPTEVELICYRICQEALHNITKHASPTAVDVAFTVNADNVQLSISDNGCGFEPTRHKESGHWGLGLLGMHERAAAINGTATIESSVGNGTRILVSLPIGTQEHRQ